MMKVGLFIPCYVNQLYPRVAIACLELLERLGIAAAFPAGQTCCGQPMANAGFEHLSKDCERLFDRLFGGFDYIVCPSGSCTLHLRQHVHSAGKEKGGEFSSRIFELTEFMTDVMQLTALQARFPGRVALHQSCHGQRGLGLSQMTELAAPPFSKPEKLLRMVDGLELVTLTRKDECCGFGGMFSIGEEAVSVRMAQDRLEDFIAHDVACITGVDMSCLMHLDGVLRRQKINVPVSHIAEILNAR